MERVNEGEPVASVHVEQAAGEALVTVRGELDLTNVGQLEEAIASLDSPLERLVLDLSDLGFMDSSAIAVLLRAAAGGVAVQLRNPSATVREVVAATGLTDVLQVIES